MNEADSVPTEYTFTAYRASERASEVFAVKVPVDILQSCDAGILVSIEWEPLEIASGSRSWSLLQGVQHVHHLLEGGSEPTAVGLWVDGVNHELPLGTEVWLGWHPHAPNHFQRGGFTR